MLDSALLVAAKEKGFAATAGVDLMLVRETSWANIRDRLAVGHFNVAHMLAPMPIACNLGLTPLASRTIAPIALGLGGNAITVSNALWAEMEAAGAGPDLDPRNTGAALKAVLEERPFSLGEVAKFHVGQVIELDATPRTLARLESNNQVLFWCQIGQLDGFYAMQVADPVDQKREFVDDILSR